MKDFNTKKEIKDIMLEMESLSERQIATTLTEETLKELMASNGIDAIDTQALIGNDINNTCSDSDCKRTIDFCCKTSITRGFNVRIDNTSMQYNTSLFCFTDPCPCNVTVSPGKDCPEFCIPLYPLRVVGCIQYRVSTGNITGERSVGSANGFVSYEGSICVNKIVDYQQCPPTLTESQPKPIPDSAVNATVRATLEKCELVLLGETPVVKFTGTFTLPNTCEPVECPYPPCTQPVCPTICPPCPSCSPCPTNG